MFLIFKLIISIFISNSRYLANPWRFAKHEHVLSRFCPVLEKEKAQKFVSQTPELSFLFVANLFLFIFSLK